MKKLIITLLMIFISINTFTQEKVTDSLNISNTERILDKYGTKVAEGFSKFMETATPVAKEGFNLVVKLEIAKGIVYILPLFLGLLFMFLFTKEYHKINNNPERGDPARGPFDEDNVTPIIVIYIILFLLMSVVACVCTYNGITHLIAPEWYAIKDIMELF